MTDEAPGIRHHPSEATLVAYAAGTLWAAAAVVVGAHLVRCARCAGTVRLAETVGGTILDSLPPAPLGPGMLERTLGRLDERPGDLAVPAGSPHPRDGRSIVPSLLRDAQWRWLAPGVRRAVLLRQPEAGTLHLLRIRPGVALPRHSHRGTELTLVIAGSFADGAGRYGPDDVAEADDAVSHQPIAEGSEDCVCLVAAQGRLRFGSLVSGLFGAFARI